MGQGTVRPDNAPRGYLINISLKLRKIITSNAFKVVILFFVLFMITSKMMPLSDCQSNEYMPWMMIKKGTINFDSITQDTADYMYYLHGGDLE